MENNSYKKQIEDFIATALEEQRLKVLAEVEGWLVDDFNKSYKNKYIIYRDTHGTEWFHPSCVIAELRAKLEEQKREIVKTFLERVLLDSRIKGEDFKILVQIAEPFLNGKETKNDNN